MHLEIWVAKYYMPTYGSGHRIFLEMQPRATKLHCSVPGLAHTLSKLIFYHPEGPEQASLEKNSRGQQKKGGGCGGWGFGLNNFQFP